MLFAPWWRAGYRGQQSSAGGERSGLSLRIQLMIMILMIQSGSSPCCLRVTMRSSWLSTQPLWKVRGVRSSSVSCRSFCDGGG